MRQCRLFVLHHRPFRLRAQRFLYAWPEHQGTGHELRSVHVLRQLRLPVRALAPQDTPHNETAGPMGPAVLLSQGVLRSGQALGFWITLMTREMK